VFVLVITVCMGMDARSCSTILYPQSFLTEDACVAQAVEDYPLLSLAFPVVADVNCLAMPGEKA
jgi:hypothetical protein